MVTFLFISCSSPSVHLFGSVAPAGDPSFFMEPCQKSEPQALLLKEATQKKSCQEAWEVLATVEAVDISSAPIDDLSLLSGMTNLKKISAYDNNIKDIQSLIHLDRMEELYLMSNKIEDISPLVHLRQLQVLRLDGNLISDISILPKLKRLNRLGLDQNKISDFRPIARLDDIQALNTNFNPVNVDFCPTDGPGPKQLFKYCKRMHKHHNKLKEDQK